MGFLKKLTLMWKVAPVEAKVEAVISLLCDIGTGIAATDVSKKLGKDHSVPGRLLIGLGVTGLGIAAGNIAGKAVNNSYGPAIVMVVNKFKESKAEEKPVKEEEQTDAGNK